jgi:hypothetical protein
MTSTDRIPIAVRRSERPAKGPPGSMRFRAASGIIDARMSHDADEFVQAVPRDRPFHLTFGQCRKTLPGNLERGNPCDGHRPGYSCRPQSPAAALIDQIANLIPGGIAQFRTQPTPAETCVAQLKALALARLGNDVSQALLDKRAQGRALPGGDLARFAQQRIGNFECGFHDHIDGLTDMGSDIMRRSYVATGTSAAPLRKWPCNELLRC